jgi:hypothetical protein
MADLPKQWAESLEFKTLPDGNNEEYAEFTQEKKHHFDDI